MRPKFRGITHGAPNQPVAGRKFCAGCGRWRILTDFAMRPSGRLDSYCGACRRTEFRRRTKNLTPEQRERRRESERFYRDRLRKENGTIDRYVPRGRTVVDRIEAVWLDREPLAAEVMRSGLSDLALAKAAGVPPRTIYRFRTGESQHIRLDVADKVAYALGLPLALIYGTDPKISRPHPPLPGQMSLLDAAC